MAFPKFFSVEAVLNTNLASLRSKEVSLYADNEYFIDTLG